MILLPKAPPSTATSLDTMSAAVLVERLYDATVEDGDYAALNRIFINAGVIWECPCGYTMMMDDERCYGCDFRRDSTNEERVEALTQAETDARQFLREAMADYNVAEGLPATSRMCLNCGLSLEPDDPLCWVCWINGNEQYTEVTTGEG